MPPGSKAATGARTIFHEPSTLPRLAAEDLPDELIASARVLLLDPETTYLAGLLPEQGGPWVVDDAERWRDGMTAERAFLPWKMPAHWRRPWLPATRPPTIRVRLDRLSPSTSASHPYGQRTAAFRDP